MNFIPLDADAKETIVNYMKKTDSRSCDMCFATYYVWRDTFHTAYAIVEDNLVMKSETDSWLSFVFPIGDGDKVKAIRQLKAYANGRGRKLVIDNVYREQEEWLQEHFPGEFLISYNRDLADYIYDCEKLKTLSGRKYHGKKNHVNQFNKAYNWTYEAITDENREECFAMLDEWAEKKGELNARQRGELKISECYLREMDFLEQKGGLIRVDGKIVALAIGEKHNSDTFVVHIEKALKEYRGAYAIINQQFLVHEAGDCFYVNREDDTGDQGLRTAKLSYKPLYLLEKGYAMERKEPSC